LYEKEKERYQSEMAEYQGPSTVNTETVPSGEAQQDNDPSVEGDGDTNTPMEQVFVE
jgi:hypothetical protein